MISFIFTFHTSWARSQIVVCQDSQTDLFDVFVSSFALVQGNLLGSKCIDLLLLAGNICFKDGLETSVA